MSDSEGYWIPDLEQIKTDEWRREMLRRPSGGGSVYRDREIERIVEKSNPEDSETQKEIAWEAKQANLIAARPGHVYVTYEEHLEELRLEKERREAEALAERKRQEAADRLKRQRREKEEAKRLSLASESITI